MIRVVKRGFVTLLVVTLMLSCFVPATMAEKKDCENCVVEAAKETVSFGEKAVERADATKKTVKPQKISISGSDTVKKGKTAKLSAKVSPADAPQGVTWKTSDKKVATVSAKGVVTGVKAGKAIITATSTVNKKIKATFTITVPGSKATKVTVTTPSGELSLTQKTMKLTAKATPADAAQEFTWKSSKPKVATVDENGVVMAVAAGTAKITATAKDGSKKKGAVTISVIDENTAKQGWLTEGGDTFFYDEKGNKVTGWKKIDQDWYFFKPDGVMVTGDLEHPYDQLYLADDYSVELQYGEFTKNGKYTIGNGLLYGTELQWDPAKVVTINGQKTKLTAIWIEFYKDGTGRVWLDSPDGQVENQLKWKKQEDHYILSYEGETWQLTQEKHSFQLAINGTTLEIVLIQGGNG